eukprot:Opistho-2@8267
MPSKARSVCVVCVSKQQTQRHYLTRTTNTSYSFYLLWHGCAICPLYPVGLLFVFPRLNLHLAFVHYSHILLKLASATLQSTYPPWIQRHNTARRIIPTPPALGCLAHTNIPRPPPPGCRSSLQLPTALRDRSRTRPSMGPHMARVHKCPSTALRLPRMVLLGCLPSMAHRRDSPRHISTGPHSSSRSSHSMHPREGRRLRQLPAVAWPVTFPRNSRICPLGSSPRDPLRRPRTSFPRCPDTRRSVMRLKALRSFHRLTSRPSSPWRPATTASPRRTSRRTPLALPCWRTSTSSVVMARERRTISCSLTFAVATPFTTAWNRGESTAVSRGPWNPTEGPPSTGLSVDPRLHHGRFRCRRPHPSTTTRWPWKCRTRRPSAHATSVERRATCGATHALAEDRMCAFRATAAACGWACMWTTTTTTTITEVTTTTRTRRRCMHRRRSA